MDHNKLIVQLHIFFNYKLLTLFSGLGLSCPKHRTDLLVYMLTMAF